MIRHHTTFGATAAALLLAGALWGAGSSQASSSSPAVKKYTSAGAPATIVGGVKTAVTIKLTNTTKSGDDNGKITIGAARIVVPTGLALTGSLSYDYVTGAGVQAWPSTWTKSYTGNTLELTNIKVATGSYVAVTFTVNSCLAGNYPWSTDVRQSNDFNGTNNKLTLDGTDPVTAITQPCQLAFTGQPNDTFPTAIITNAKYASTPSSPVAVTVLSGDGQYLIPDWAAQITLDKTGGDPTAALTGGGAVTPASGVATWAPSLDKKSPGTDPNYTPYQLTATSPGLTSATSNPFTILFKALVDCSVGTVCQTPTVPAPNGGSATAQVNGDTNGKLVLDWNSNEPAPDCAGYDEATDTVAFNLTGAANLTGLTKTVTLIQPIPANTTNKNADWQNQICFRSPSPFPGFEIADMLHLLSDVSAPAPGTGLFSTHTANQVVTDTTTPANNRWQGLLFDCDLVSPLDACIVSRHVTLQAGPTTAGSVTFVLKVPAGDPWAR